MFNAWQYDAIFPLRQQTQWLLLIILRLSNNNNYNSKRFIVLKQVINNKAFGYKQSQAVYKFPSPLKS